jgi:hypothetical protein
VGFVRSGSRDHLQGLRAYCEDCLAVLQPASNLSLLLFRMMDSGAQQQFLYVWARK